MTLNKTGHVSWSHLIKNSLHVAKILLRMNLKRSHRWALKRMQNSVQVFGNCYLFFLSAVESCHCFALTADAGREKRAGSEIGDKRNENIIFGSLILSHSNWLLHVELGLFFPPFWGSLVYSQSILPNLFSLNVYLRLLSYSLLSLISFY